ncbi:MAG: LLM class flavin-dependent oxidoreductase [Acidimicrobiia bacterium]|nr:LLM class flavin-dependent oxidoreductase [Actinomycetota bacterium]NDF31586.1 LLM class flavin-dependent oxidoreductase [Acidimicrobiia bacterium]
MSLVPGIRIGIQLPEVERVVRWSEYREMATVAETVGFDSMWLGDHLLYRGDGRPERGPWEAWTMLAALAAETERIELGPLVACVGFHPPSLIAKMAATIDDVSAGRFILGIGAGWNQPEFDAFGIPFDRRAARFEEALRIIEPLVAGGRVTLDGEFHRVDDAVLLPTPHRPVPIMIGSIGDRVLRAGLRGAAWWNTWFDWFGNSAEGFAELNGRISRLCTEVGRDQTTLKRSACLLVVTDPDAGERPRPVEYSAATLTDARARILELRDAGADEVIVVSDPIDVRSIRAIAEALG